ncbi:MAG: haloalkane dehalogenase [Ahrensia sp.]|nr:haloalkane dehalogenase [Ahrensia sp.]
MEVLRTPDDRFEGLPDWPYEPRYVDDLPGYAPMRVHYVDEGPKEADRVVLCLHGEPTWAYLYRKMIPVFLESGARVVAPDWLGFGRSDKPVDDGVYTFDFHRDMIVAFVEQLDLNNITLVVQDWGGLLGLTLPQDMPQRFSRLLIMNTAIATGRAPGPGFLDWKAYVAANPDLDVGALMKRATPILSEKEAAAYDAPFLNQSYKAGVRRFPEMVMVEPGMDGIEISKRAVAFWREEWAGESFMAIGEKDPVLGVETMMAIKALIKNCPDPMMVKDAGHFVQEWGEPIARAALNHWGDL